MNPLYPRVAQRADNRCEYCLAPERAFNISHEVEHVVPVSHGGTDEDANLALSCHACNLYKSDFRTGEDPETQAAIRLFHPRQDVWGDHFRVDLETATIEGQTPIGRATIVRLQMNRNAQIVARRLWISWEIYP